MRKTSRWPSIARSALCGLAALWIAVTAGAAMLELDEYLQRADAARQRGDWQSVASQLAQALNHPDLPGSGMQRSAVHLEYGRALGVLCQYAEAEKYLLLARDIARADGGSTVDALTELAAISAAQGHSANAESYLRQLESATTQPARSASSARQGAKATPYGTRCPGR